MQGWVKEVYRLVTNKAIPLKNIHMFSGLLPTYRPMLFLLATKAQPPYTVQAGINKIERILQDED